METIPVPLRVEWSIVSVDCGEQCAAIDGEMVMLQWYALSLDSTLCVCDEDCVLFLVEVL